MKTNVKILTGNWDIGFSLDKHSTSSKFIGYNEFGHEVFDTKRTEAGEALYQLKSKSDLNQASILAQQLFHHLGSHFQETSCVISMPPSKKRPFQPAEEIAKQVAALMVIPYIDNLLIKTKNTDQIKNIFLKKDRIKTLCSNLKVNDVLGEGVFNVLIVDDLYDTGSSLEAATAILREYTKIKKIFVATITRRRS